MKRNDKGITLIALIITIIILMILAGVSVNLLLGENGIINKAKTSQKAQDIGRIQERLELLKVEILIEDHQVNINNYLAKLGSENIKEKYKVNYIESDAGLNYAYVLLEDKYRFFIEDTLNGNVVIKYLENAEREEIKVTATDYKGVYDGNAYGIAITCIPSDVKIEYSADGENYSEEPLKFTDVGVYTVYYKVSRLGFSTATGSKTVTIEDNILPLEAEIQISGSTSTTSLPATLNAKVTHIDNESGVNIEECKYILNTSSGNLGTDASSYEKTFKSNEESITIELSSVADYYLHVLSVDDAGNATETIKGPINVAPTTYHTHTSDCQELHTHIGDSTSCTGCYTIPHYYYTYTETSQQWVATGCQHKNSRTEGEYGEDYDYWRCYDCGSTSRYGSKSPEGYYNTVTNTISADGLTLPSNATLTETKYDLSCGITEGEFTGNYICGKTEKTIEKYAITY